MELPDSVLSVDPDGGTDTPRNSLLPIASAILAGVGLLAIVAPWFIFFSLASVLLGLLAMAFAQRWELSSGSMRVASISVLVSLFSGLAGGGYQWTADRLIVQKATEVATAYMQALAAGDRTEAIRMTGLPPLVIDAGENSQNVSREQKAVRNFLADPVIQDVIRAGKSASWKSTGVRSRYRTGTVHEFEIGFIDQQATNPRTLVVAVKRIPPIRQSVEQRNQWFVEDINVASQ